MLASEFRRFRSRRLVQVLVALELLAIVATGVIVFLTQEYALVGLPDVLMGTALVLVSVGWMLGASAIGADWHAGHRHDDPDLGAAARTRPVREDRGRADGSCSSCRW